MFTCNRYSKIYLSIVTKAQARGLDKRVHSGYFEWHHVIPTSLGGADVDENKVLLTAREHFLCHLLLTKMTTGKDLVRMRHAFSYMSLSQSPTHQRGHIPSHWYAKAREMISMPRDEEWKQKISRAQTGKKKSIESVEKMRATLTGRSLSASHKQNISKGAVGFSEAARLARLQTKQGSFTVTTPEGNTFTVTNLKAWCLKNGFNYHTAINNSKLPNAIARGPLVGYSFTVLPSPLC